ncbi:hypothetical protein LUTEI9C_100078 [Luteimonas sp. 9C]|nr:hypothetical protein LUTEI9C_100078 [Luteimonas sp. 9C]
MSLSWDFVSRKPVFDRHRRVAERARAGQPGPQPAPAGATGLEPPGGGDPCARRLIRRDFHTLPAATRGRGRRALRGGRGGAMGGHGRRRLGGCRR